jgi:hypothetical protein
MHPSRSGFLLDINEPAVDDRVEGVQLALNLTIRQAAAARPAAPSVPLISALIGAAITAPRAAMAAPVAPIIIAGVVGAVTAGPVGVFIAGGAAIAVPLVSSVPRRRGRGSAFGCGGGRAPPAAVSRAGRPSS